MYKLNRFHCLVKHKPRNILYNALTGSLMWANNAFAEAFSRLGSNPRVSDGILLELFEDEEVVNELKEQAIIIPEGLNELSVIRKQHDDIRFADTSTNIEFIVTYSCNLDCVYCYAIREESAMTPEMARRAASFAIGFAESRQSKAMMVQFMGGEPLLNRNAIEIIVEQMLEFKEANEITMATSLTTNGVLLDRSSLDLIRRLGPIQVQITVDGPEEVHNTRRRLPGGNAYRMTMNNILNLNQYIDELVIRVNIDRENIASFPGLLQKLVDSNLPHAFLSIVPTFSHTDQSSHYHSYCYGEKEIPLEFRDLWRKAVEAGFAPSWNPLPVFMSCGVVSPGTLAIDPYGDIYKCAATYGDKEHAVGTIFSGLDSSPDSLYSYYIKRDAVLLNRGICNECPSLPTCMGGCAFSAERKTGSMFEPDCRFDKSVCLEDLVRLYSDWYKRRGFTVSPRVELPQRDHQGNQDPA